MATAYGKIPHTELSDLRAQVLSQKVTISKQNKELAEIQETLLYIRGRSAVKLGIVDAQLRQHEKQLDMSINNHVKNAITISCLTEAVELLASKR